MLKYIFSIIDKGIHKEITILGIRIKYKNKYLILKNEIEFLLNAKIENLYYELKDNKISNKIKIPKVMSKEETYSQLLNTSKSICRFGDGEFTLIINKNCGIGFQNSNEKLSKRLIEVLSSNNENVLIAIPDVFGSLRSRTLNSQKYWTKYLYENRQNIYNLLDFDRVYADATISRPYISSEKGHLAKIKSYFDSFKKIVTNKNIVIVEGEFTRLGVGNDLLDGCESVQRILVPALNAFDKYNAILDTCIKQPKDSLFILALGPTATVLAYDLALKEYRAIDIGHIDIEYEWFLRQASSVIPVENKYVNEAGKPMIKDSVEDVRYYKEIIAKIV